MIRSVNDLITKASINKKTVAFPEATDTKLLEAINLSKQKGICKPVLVESRLKIESIAKCVGISLDDVEIFDTTNEEIIKQLAKEFCEKYPDYSEKGMIRRGKDPLYVALMLQAIEKVDFTFAGFTNTTEDVLLASQYVLGFENQDSVMSSYGLVEIQNFNGYDGNIIAFGDSGVSRNPSSNELAQIAIQICDETKKIVGWEPRCALLSYSTFGSGSGPSVDKVKEAVKIANEKRPDLLIEGEMQLDTALNQEIGIKKAKNTNSKVAGKANIIIWPNLDTGNVGIKLLQQCAKASAYMVMLMGFSKPMVDCSRGATVEEVVGTIALCCLR